MAEGPEVDLPAKPPKRGVQRPVCLFHIARNVVVVIDAAARSRGAQDRDSIVSNRGGERCALRQYRTHGQSDPVFCQLSHKNLPESSPVEDSWNFSELDARVLAVFGPEMNLRRRPAIDAV